MVTNGLILVVGILKEEEERMRQNKIRRANC
jgi:hypothetical protein